MNNIQVSIIVCIYNSIWEKLSSTLKSILIQQNVSYEIVIADDGSENNYFDNIEGLFRENGFTQFLLVQHTSNVGTVRNVLDAMEKSKGEYVCTISPGDLLYDEFCLNNIYLFSKNNCADVCFGNAFYYSCENGIHLYDKLRAKPSRRDLYNGDISNNLLLVGVLWGGYILGAGLIRERNNGIKYLKMVVDACKYIEDNSVIPFMVLDGLKVLHFNGNFIWYEYGTGITTSHNIEWKRKITQDFINREKLLHTYYANNPIVDANHIMFNSKSRVTGVIQLLVKHPMVLLMYIRMKIMKKYYINVEDADISKLQRMLK